MISKKHDTNLQVTNYKALPVFAPAHTRVGSHSSDRVNFVLVVEVVPCAPVKMRFFDLRRGVLDGNVPQTVGKLETVKGLAVERAAIVGDDLRTKQSVRVIGLLERAIAGDLSRIDPFP